MHNTKLPLSSMLTNTMDLYPEPFAIKDLDGRCLYANQPLVRMHRLKSVDCLIGKLDSEVRSKLTESENNIQEWKKQCQYVSSTKKKLCALEIHPNAVNLPYITTILPLMNDQNIISGTAIYFRSLDVFTLSDFIKGKKPGSLLLSKPDDFFSEKECEIIFLKMQGLTNREIAEMLCRSPRTIENRIQQLYGKSGSNNLDEFKQFCINRKIDRYLPKRFLTQQKITFQNQLNSDDEWEW